MAAEALEAAAHDAARAASISRSRAPPRDAALEAARQQLDWHGLACTNELDPSSAARSAGERTSFDDAFSSAVGENATVTVKISCRVSFKDISSASCPACRVTAINAKFTSPLDRYRSRQ